MKNVKTFLCTLLATLWLLSCNKDTTPAPEAGVSPDSGIAADRYSVVIPGGSVNALAAALAEGTTVVLAPGLHTETGTVTVTGYHNIIGQPGAVLRLKSPAFTGTAPLAPGLHLYKAGGSSIMNVKIEASESLGGTAILINESEKVTVQGCDISGFQYSVLVEKSPRVTLFKNRIQCNTAWQTGALPQAHGVVIVNGEGARAEQNEISGALFGFWACDKNGAYRRNYTHDNMVGFILCKVPTPALILPDGSLIGAQFSATRWIVRDNVSTGNYDNGIMVIDGASYNTVIDNDVHGNGLAPLAGSAADIEVFADSYLFGFLTPAAHHNVINSAKFPGTTIKNCGTNTTVSGGTLWSTVVYPCR
ncbi:MAG: right-handed parallel beta-helix repeat-containing protein [Saprospirales bacterium]|nr:right-handed parallel beta-helix repeat-containing protein [Saprospirales bacterium]